MSRPSNWIADQPATGQRLAWHELTDAMREIVEGLLDMDAPEADLLAAAESARRFAKSLEATRQGTQHWGFAEFGPAGSPRAMMDRSPIIGRGNAIAPPLELRIEGELVVGSGSFGLQYEGPPGHVHGGFVAAAMDEVLGMAQSLTGKPGMTGTLTIRYRRPTPLHQQLRFTARVDRVEGRKIFASGTLHHGETLCAEAEGVFVSVDFEAMRRLSAPG